MKTLLSFIFIISVGTIFSSNSLYAANISADKLVGTWNVTAQISDNVVYKNWAGAITVTKRGKKITGVLDWSCNEGDWHVQEEFSISIVNNIVTLQGTAVNIVSGPKSDSKYYLDNFTFSYDEISNQVTPITVSDEKNRGAMFTITKI